MSQGRLVLLALMLANAAADTPANCTHRDVLGQWLFHETARNHTSSVSCQDLDVTEQSIVIMLQHPNIAVDQFNNTGTWTMIYNQGFEVTVNERSYFAFSYYEQNGKNVTSYCGRTFPGWAHDTTLRHWSCFSAEKHNAIAAKQHQLPFFDKDEKLSRVEPQEAIISMVKEVNAAQRSWTARVHQPFLTNTYGQLLRLRGGKRSWMPHRPSPAPASIPVQQVAARLPPSFDWRNVSGINYISPVRNQLECGSCYIFASTGMLESRLKIRTNNTLDLDLSEQEVLICSQLSQGCDGGFPYLIAGRYGRDYGLVDELCSPYSGQETVCKTTTCDRRYTATYHYIGGYYGASNEEGMMMALMRGPIVIGFEVYSDFYHYSSGIYHHTGIVSPNMTEPYDVVNHNVLVVGYGADEETKEKYWIVKNSWGAVWGDKGYFRIRRGTDECGIESISVIADPIP